MGSRLNCSQGAPTCCKWKENETQHGEKIKKVWSQMILNENVNIAELDFYLRHLNELLVAAGVAPHVMFSCFCLFGIRLVFTISV